MKTLLKKYPLPISGLILGLAALGNLMQSYSELLRSIFGIISGLLLILFVLKLVLFPKDVKEDLKNPVIASVFPTVTMAIMLLSTYFKPFLPSLAFMLWIFAVALHVALIIWFTWRFVMAFKIKQVFPSWFIVYVGIAVASVTSGAYNMPSIGKTAFWFGLITYLILLPIVLYRIIKIKEMPEATQPTLIILAAPASLLLAGYMNSFSQKNMTLVYFVMALSFIFYIVAFALLPKVLKLKFYPSYSGFTFPLIISGIGMKLTNGFLANINQSLLGLKYMVTFQEIMALLITIYVLIKYIQFLLPSKPTAPVIEKPIS